MRHSVHLISLIIQYGHLELKRFCCKYQDNHDRAIHPLPIFLTNVVR